MGVLGHVTVKGEEGERQSKAKQSRATSDVQSWSGGGHQLTLFIRVGFS